MNESIWEKGKCEPWPPCFKLLNTEYLVAWEEVNQSWFLQRVRTCSTNHIFLPNANDILECRIKTRITLTEHEWIWLKFFIWYFLRCTVLIYIPPLFKMVHFWILEKILDIKFPLKVLFVLLLNLGMQWNRFWDFDLTATSSTSIVNSFYNLNFHFTVLKNNLNSITPCNFRFHA